MAPTKRSSGPTGPKLRSKKTTNVDKVGGRTKKQREDRPTNEAQRLAAVNGVVIASKVRPGESPQQGVWTPDRSTIYPCSICGMRFKRKYNVQSHMPACVKRNGNPNGAHWDDAWNGSISAHDDDDDEHEGDAEASTDSEESESEDQREELDLPDFPPDSPLPNNSVADNSPVDLTSASPSASPSSSPSASPSLRRHDREAPMPGPQPHDNYAVGSFGPYDPSLPFDHLTNEALIDIAHNWDYFYFLQHVGQGNMGTHPQLERVMEELETRGIVREYRAWTMELEGVDMGFRRVERDRPGS